MDIAITEDNLSGAYSESPDFIMEVGLLQHNWHNEVNGKMADLCSAVLQQIPLTYSSLFFFLETVLKSF